jgi:probable F420-dependent oxidoreductase
VQVNAGTLARSGTRPGCAVSEETDIGMKYGLFSMNMDACSEPKGAARIARVAEDAGFESLWAGEHVVLPDPRIPPSPMNPEDPILDPVIALTFLAAHTRRVRLGTGIIILPQRNPLVLAKELASLDILSGGRLIFGVGAGYLEPEFRALGASFTDRGPRTVEYLRAMISIWDEPKPAYAGRFVAFEGVQAHPRPVQRPHPPIVMGGHSPPAFRRAVEQANGWYGFALDVDATAACLDDLRGAAERYVRPSHLGKLEISVTPPRDVDAATVERYATLGVDRLILMPRGRRTVDAIEAFVSGVAATLPDFAAH